MAMTVHGAQAKHGVALHPVEAWPMYCPQNVLALLVQGDCERSLGMKILPLMDRNQKAGMIEFQVKPC